MKATREASPKDLPKCVKAMLEHLRAMRRVLDVVPPELLQIRPLRVAVSASMWLKLIAGALLSPGEAGERLVLGFRVCPAETELPPDTWSILFDAGPGL